MRSVHIIRYYTQFVSLSEIHSKSSSSNFAYHLYIYAYTYKFKSTLSATLNQHIMQKAWFSPTLSTYGADTTTIYLLQYMNRFSWYPCLLHATPQPFIKKFFMHLHSYSSFMSYYHKLCVNKWCMSSALQEI